VTKKTNYLDFVTAFQRCIS